MAASLYFTSALKSLLGFPPDSIQLLCSVTEVRLVASPQTMTSPRNPPFGSNSADRYLTAALHQLFKCFSAARRSEKRPSCNPAPFPERFHVLWPATTWGGHAWSRVQSVKMWLHWTWLADKKHPEDLFCVISCTNRFLYALNSKINHFVIIFIFRGKKTKKCSECYTT